MPSPSKTVYVSPISGNGGNFQSNALDSFKNAERTELQADQDNCAKNLNVLMGYKMAMLMSDKNELQMKNFRDEEKVENKTVKEEKGK